MSHVAQRAFFDSVKARFPDAFNGVRVLDCGSLDVNGSLKGLFTDSDYLGVDLQPGRNVDLVSAVHDLPFGLGSFQAVVSAEMLEHDEHWRDSLHTMYRLLDSGGLLALSMATKGRPEHGTATVPDTAGHGNGIWGSSPDYYRPLSKADLRSVFSMRRDFRTSKIEENAETHDLYFWGVKA